MDCGMGQLTFLFKFVAGSISSCVEVLFSL